MQKYSLDLIGSRAEKIRTGACDQQPTQYTVRQEDLSDHIKPKIILRQEIFIPTFINISCRKIINCFILPNI